MQKFLKAAAAIVAGGLIFLNPAAAQTWEWHKANGLGGTPTGMAHDASGGKWMSLSYGGLAHFDGSKWTRYSNVNTWGGIPTDNLQSVAIDRDGNKWVGSEAGVSKFDGKQWTRYTPESTGGGLPTGTVRSIAQDRKGNLWFGVSTTGGEGEAGVARFDGRTWTKWGARSSRDVSNAIFLKNLAIDRDDNVWVATPSVAYMFNGSRWSAFDKDNTSGAFTAAFSLTVDTRGTVWFAGDGVVTRYDNGRWSSIPGPYPARDPRSAVADSIAVDGDGTVWVAMGASNNPASLPGLFKYDGSRWTRYLLDEDWRRIDHLFIDPRGKLWVAPGGLVEFDGTVRTRYTGDNTLTGLPWGDVEALSPDAQGNIWAGTFYAAAAWDGRQWQMQRPTAARGTDPDQMNITQVATAPGNTTWFATWNDSDKVATFMRRSGSAWTTFTQSDVGAPIGQINAMAVDSKGRLWAATDSGALMYDGTRWTRYTMQNTNSGLPSNMVRGVAIDAKDQVWFGTAAVNPLSAGNEGGVARFDGSTWTNWTAAGTNSGLITNNIRAVQFDKKGRLWAVVGASLALRKLGGLAVFDGTRWQTLTAAMNSPYLEHDIRRITADHKGGIWLAMDKGATYFDGDSKWQFYNRANTNNALTSPFSDTEILDIAVDKADNVWMSVKKGGLAVLKAPGATARSTAQPEPQRVVSQLATFADLPEVAAAKAAAAKQKADADKAKADQLAAFNSMTKPQVQASFCKAFGEVEKRSGLVPLFTQYEASPYGVDDFLVDPACQIDGLKGSDRGPALHMVVDNFEALSTFMPTIFVYYARRRNNEGLFTRAMNVRNTRGETLLDYLESRVQQKEIHPDDAAKFARYACSKGAVYAKANKNCP